jgi:oligopeptide/dipeptide ABC transporter ATP-binding protein
MELLKSLSREADLALVLITHDLGVAAEQADKVMVMYAGRTVETGLTDEVFAKPYHPYTQALLSSMPDLTDNSNRLGIISGAPPVLTQLPEGCAFRPRCQFVAPMCRLNRPQLFVSGPSRASACFRVDDIFKKQNSNV